MRHAFTLLIALLLATPAYCGAPLAQSLKQSQTDELDKLFAQLRQPATGSASLLVEPNIWYLWTQAGTPDQNKQLETATDAMNRANFAEALEKLNVLIGQTQSFPEAYNKRATLYFLMGRFDESLVDIVKTLDLEPRHFGALAGRGMIYQKQGKTADALRAFKEALSINPNSTGAKLSVLQLEKLLPEL